MTITEWFARAVATGLMPDWKNVIAYWSGDCANVYNDDTDDFIITTLEVEEFDQIRLRSNGKDLYELEWKKPTECDIGKMCWHLKGKVISLAEIKSIKSYNYAKSPEALNDKELVFWCNDCQIVQGDRNSWGLLLLTDHNQIAPTEQDFKRIYGE